MPLELTAEDETLHTRREHALVVVLRSRLLRLQAQRECEKSNWRVARSRFRMRKLRPKRGQQ
jgi:hypothetical protein